MRPPWASAAAAAVAELPASTQPSSATTTDGDSMAGRPRRSLYRLIVVEALGSGRSGLRPARRGRRFDDDLRIPVLSDRREDVDDLGALRPDDEVVRHVAEDPPRGPGPDLARLSAD